MSNDKIVEFLAEKNKREADKLASLEGRGLKSGGGDGTFDGMEARVTALEKKFDKIEAKLDSISTELSYVKGKIDGLPSAASFGELKGRVDSLPTTAKFATMISIATGIIVVLTKWQDVIAAIR